MLTRFFHDLKKKIVYRSLAAASPEYTKHKPPRYAGCFVTIESKWLSANWTKTEERGWVNQGTIHEHQSFDQRDRPEAAERMIFIHHSPPYGEEITEEPYNALLAEYAAEAKRTRP